MYKDSRGEEFTSYGAYIKFCKMKAKSRKRTMEYLESHKDKFEKEYVPTYKVTEAKTCNRCKKRKTAATTFQNEHVCIPCHLSIIENYGKVV